MGIFYTILFYGIQHLYHADEFYTNFTEIYTDLFYY